MGNKKMSLPFSSFFFVVAGILVLLALLQLGKSFFVPLAFALLLAFMLFPLCNLLEKIKIPRMLATVVSFIVIISVLAIVFWLFYGQITSVVEEYSNFEKELYSLLQSAEDMLTKGVNKVPGVEVNEVLEKSQNLLKKGAGNMVSGTVSTTSSVISGVIMTFIYAFLILIYRSGIKSAFIKFASNDFKAQYSNMIDEIKSVGSQYSLGMLLLIAVLGTLNSLGLLILGIDYAFFFGFLAAFLSIIPYVGTTLGGLLPALFALLNHDSLFYPLMVVLIFAVTQFIEGNFLSPKIVGGQLKINPLSAIFFLLLGAFLWGVPGMIVSLPFAAIFKKITSYYKELEGVYYLMDSDIYDKGK